MQPECPQCGYTESHQFFFRPWHVKGRHSVRDYVASLGEEAHEWLLALYVDEHMQLLSVETIARGDVSGVDVDFKRIFHRGFHLMAHGFLLVHNHPSGDPRPSAADVQVTVRLAHAAKLLGMRMHDHLVIAKDRMLSVGHW